MEIYLSDRQADLPLAMESVRVAALAFLSEEGLSCDELSISFVPQEEISALHETHFGDPSPTDCLSFPIDSEAEGGYRLLGDLVICPRAALDYVAKEGGNPYREVTLYLIHGLLHLIGYGDLEEGERVLMRGAEERHLAHLTSADLLLKPPEGVVEAKEGRLCC